jgi:hypothetical protein
MVEIGVLRLGNLHVYDIKDDLAGKQLSCNVCLVPSPENLEIDTSTSVLMDRYADQQSDKEGKAGYAWPEDDIQIPILNRYSVAVLIRVRAKKEIIGVATLWLRNLTDNKPVSIVQNLEPAHKKGRRFNLADPTEGYDIINASENNAEIAKIGYDAIFLSGISSLHKSRTASTPAVKDAISVYESLSKEGYISCESANEAPSDTVARASTDTSRDINPDKKSTFINY